MQLGNSAVVKLRVITGTISFSLATLGLFMTPNIIAYLIFPRNLGIKILI